MDLPSGVPPQNTASLRAETTGALLPTLCVWVSPGRAHGMKEPPRRWGTATLTRSALGEDISGRRAQSNRGAKRRQGSRRPHRRPDLGQKTRTASHQRHRWPKLCKLLSTTYITGWVFELEHRALHLFLLACSLDWFSGGIPGS